jgi:hypothetical protein
MYKFFWCALLAIALLYCRREEKAPPPDISNIEIEMEWRRFDQDLFALDTNDLAHGLARLEAEYPELSAVFFEQILGSKNPMLAPQGHVEYVRGFLTHPSVRRLYDTCQVVFPGDMTDIRAEFESAFRYLKHYFPEIPTPSVTAIISEYTIGAFVYGENDLAVGLDFFLGADYPYLDYNPGNSNFSAYLTRTFNREHLTAKALQPLVEDLVGPPGGNRLLDLMVHNGKKILLTEHLLPFAPDSVLLEVSDEQVEWLRQNELEMWAYFLREDLLYSSKWMDIRKFVEYSPNSPGMPPEAPGRTANYLGWRIVHKYLRDVPGASLRGLLEEKDAQVILDQSRYKPRRR